MSDQDQSTKSQSDSSYSFSFLTRDVTSGIVVFLVALPLCLGIALASGAELFSGLIAGIVGGLIVGSISGSHTSVSGPAAGLTAIVAMQIALLGSFEAFMLAVVLAGVIQICFGLARAALSAFFPSSVIKGLLAAIGVILILKQIPHLVGHDNDPEGETSFRQPDDENTFSELYHVFSGEIVLSALIIGFTCIAVMVIWEMWKPLKNSLVPGPLVVVMLGVLMNAGFGFAGGEWVIERSHLVDIPVAGSVNEFMGFLRLPDFSRWNDSGIYIAAVTIAIVASLETLLNLEAVDNLDTQQRKSPTSRELVAQGCGNVASGMIGGLPVTSVVVRGSVNVNSGAKTKLSAILHGGLLLVCVGFLPAYLNMIPLSALAAILLVTGFKLASPKLFRQMWSQGRYQFIPFIATLIAIIFTDLLIGILIGLSISLLFILNSSLRRPVRRIVETHLGGDIMHIELANQVSFLNRAALSNVFDAAERDSRLLIDASDTDYIDPDVLGLIRDFKEVKAPARGVNVSLRGFRSKYQLHDEVQFADYSTRELQDQVTPDQVLEILREGNRRFRTGNRLTRDFGSQVNKTADGQTPLAAVLSCIDSRVPTELVLDLGLGDVFSVRVAGNVIGTKSLGSIEYAVAVAGVKLVLVMGHTRCGAVTSSVTLATSRQDARRATGCEHLDSIVEEITPAFEGTNLAGFNELPDDQAESTIDEIAAQNVRRTVNAIIERSSAIRQRVESGQARVVGAMYDVKSGGITFFDQE